MIFSIYMQWCRHENDIHNPLKNIDFWKEHILFNFLQIAVTRPVRNKWFWANRPGRNWFLHELSRNRQICKPRNKKMA